MYDTLFQEDNEWNLDMNSDKESKKVQGTYLKTIDNERPDIPTKFALDAPKKLTTSLLKGMAIDKIESPSITIDSDDYENQ